MDMRSSAARKQPRARVGRGIVTLIRRWWLPPPPVLDLSDEEEELLRRFGIDPADLDGRRRR